MHCRKILLLATVAICSLATVNGVAVMSVDLGSEWMKIAVVSPGKPMEIVLNKESQRKTPVAVSLRKGERLIGDPAMNTAVRFPEYAYHHFLDLVGKTVDHPAVELFKKRFPFHEISAMPETNTVLFHHKEGFDFTPEELLAMVLKKAQEIAETFTEQKITDCVITVPPYFNQAERRAVMQAADFADLKVLQLINTNTAAALNYGVFRRKDFNSSAQNIMFYDMGAADCVATIISYQVVKTKEGGYVEENPQLTVKGVGFDRTLGGLEIQLRIRDHLAKLFNAKKKIKSDVFDKPQAMAKLFKESAKVKHVLSANDHYFAQVEGLTEDVDFKEKMTRDEMIDLIGDMLDRVTKPIINALQTAGMTMSAIDQIILVGGGTRVPKVQEKLVEYVKTELGKNLNTDEAPAMGAAYQAAYLSTGFKVKKFAIKESNLYPIQVDFSRNVEKDGSTDVRQVRRMLFSYQNLYPQKKVMTFNKHTDDFLFYVSYGSDFEQLNEELKQHDGKNISKIRIKGVKDAFAKHAQEDTEKRGIKAHFRMDESGLLHLDQVEAEFKKKVVTEEEPSTLSKLGSTISNLFGGGATDEQTKDSNETEAANNTKNETDNKQRQEQKQEKDESANKTASAANAGAATTVKHVNVKESLKISKKYLDLPVYSSDVQSDIRKRLYKLDMEDKKRNEREAARNSLESFIFDTQDKIYQPQYEEAIVEEERTKIKEKLSQASDWLDEESEEQEAEVYKKKLSELQDLTRSLFNRVKEHETRPRAWDALFQTLNISKLFLSELKNVSKEDSTFSDVEIETLEKLINETTKWESEMKTEQKATALTKDPVVTVQMIAEKIASLDREIKYLLNKSKIPKSKPKEESQSETNNKTEEKTSDSKEETKEEDKKEEPTEKEETLELPGEADTTTEKPTESTTKAAAEEKPAAEEISKTEDKDHTEL